jgi:hypothetical protein
LKGAGNTVDSKAQAIREQYEQDVIRWRERGGQYVDIKPLTLNDVIFLKTVLHPTEKKETKKVTENLVNFICESKIVTAEEIYTSLGLSDKPVLKRLKVFRQFGLIRRESKKYYLPTPRMEELHKRYLKRICD